MLKGIHKIDEIKTFLENEKKENSELVDFHIIFKIDTSIKVFLLVKEIGILKKKLEKEFETISAGLAIEEISEYSYKYDKDYYEEYSYFFGDKSKVTFGLKRRLGIYTESHEEENIDEEAELLDENLPAVTTFYSYKGGMGRTTTLASFATFCAKVQKQKVVILDCDFEAPGFTNYFDMNSESLENTNGVLEYLLNRQFFRDNRKLDIANAYSFKVGRDYSGEGDIYVIPAGNLSNTPADATGRTHRQHYLEGLARLDISSVNYLTKQFQDFISDINNQLEPDIILIDSQVGFNDVLPVLVNISKGIIGFFGNNIQNQIGLEQFLDTFGNIKSSKEIFLINSMIPSLHYFEHFKKYINDYIGDSNKRFYGKTKEKNFKKYAIMSNQILAEIGTDFACKVQGKEQKFDVNWLDLIEKNNFFPTAF